MSEEERSMLEVLPPSATDLLEFSYRVIISTGNNNLKVD